MSQLPLLMPLCKVCYKRNLLLGCKRPGDIAACNEKPIPFLDILTQQIPYYHPFKHTTVARLIAQEKVGKLLSHWIHWRGLKAAQILQGEAWVKLA